MKYKYLNNKRYMRIIIYISILMLGGFLVAGCSNPFEPKRYFQLDLRLEVNQKPINISYNWHCVEEYNGPNFGPGGIIKLGWVSYPNALVAKKIGEGSLILFYPPLLLCDQHSSDTKANPRVFNPKIGLIKSVKNPEIIEIFDENRTQGINYKIIVKSSSIRRLEKPTPHYVASEEEKALLNILIKNSQGYQSVSARVRPESSWEATSTIMNQYFANAKGILIASTPSQLKSDVVGFDGANNFFPVKQSPYSQLDIGRSTIPLIKKDGFWKVSKNSNFNSALIYYGVPISGDQKLKYAIGSPPLTTVDYDGTLIQVKSSQQIFDSEKRLLIQFINKYIPAPYYALD